MTRMHDEKPRIRAKYIPEFVCNESSITNGGNDGLITDVGKLGSHLENKFILSVGPVYKINFRWIGRNYSVFFKKKYNLRVWETF